MSECFCQLIFVQVFVMFFVSLFLFHSFFFLGNLDFDVPKLVQSLC